MVGAAAVALCPSFDAGAWRAHTAPPAACDSVDARAARRAALWHRFVCVCWPMADERPALPVCGARARAPAAACYNDCTCLGFHWSGKLARCGLKADGDIPVRCLAQSVALRAPAVCPRGILRFLPTVEWLFAHGGRGILLCLSAQAKQKEKERFVGFAA